MIKISSAVPDLETFQQYVFKKKAVALDHHFFCLGSWNQDLLIEVNDGKKSFIEFKSRQVLNYYKIRNLR